jgi:hypothetical protein
MRGVLPSVGSSPAEGGRGFCVVQVGREHGAIAVIIPTKIAVRGHHGAVALVVIFEQVKGHRAVIVVIPLKRKRIRWMGRSGGAEIVGLERVGGHHGAVPCVCVRVRSRSFQTAWVEWEDGMGVVNRVMACWVHHQW